MDVGLPKRRLSVCINSRRYPRLVSKKKNSEPSKTSNDYVSSYVR